MVNAPDFSAKLALDANGLSNLKQSAKDGSPEAIKAAARQFEALFVNMMLKSMRDATPQDGVFDNEQSRTFTSMLDQQLSQSIAGRGMGLADIMARQLTRAASGLPPLPADSMAAVPPASLGAAMAMPSPFAAPLVTPGELAAAQAAAPQTTTPSARLSGAALAFHERVAAHAETASQASGIPASYMVGQAALESGWGKREIRAADGTPSYNLFGIKANAAWQGRTVETMTTEYINGIPQKRIEKFRAYDSYADAFRDFAGLISNSPRYAKVMHNLDSVHGYAHAIQNAGYATDPNYASKLISVVEKLA